jgi:hypothetical protein
MAATMDPAVGLKSAGTRNASSIRLRELDPRASVGQCKRRNRQRLILAGVARAREDRDHVDQRASCIANEALAGERCTGRERP